MDWALLWHKVYAQLLLLFKAPLFETDMWWIISPLIVTFLVMTIYFGMYRREELGWNSALSNIIVLLFVSIDLLRRIYNYTAPGSMDNYITHQILTGIIFVILLEAMLLFYFAFTHRVPKRFMFFIASPLCINIQAYVVVSLVYLEVLPNTYTLYAAILLFIILLIAAQVLRIIQYPLMILRHKNKLHEAQKLRKLAKHIRSLANKEKNNKAKSLKAEAREYFKRARQIEKNLESEEKEEFGTLKVAKKITKARKIQKAKKGKKRRK